jgi:ABC-2 type transport system ATP-binding protein
MLTLNNVTKLYGTVIGVNDISLALEPGAYGLLGPNGSGKSTLLNLITGQLKPTIGSLHVLGQPPWGNANLYRRIGYCPGGEGLYSNFSGYQWVRYLLQLHGLPTSSAGNVAGQALETVGMRAAMHRPIASYSRGMRQRIKLAQAIAHEPEFLILDEPFNGLDPVGRHEMTSLLQNWIAGGKSLLLASHILYEIESVTRSFLLISGGRLLASGTAQEVGRMLADIPSEVTLCCNQPYRLANLLMEQKVVDSLKVAGQTITVTTGRPSHLFAQLPSWLADTDMEIFEMHSTDQSLQSLFDTLMKIHQGQSV